MSDFSGYLANKILRWVAGNAFPTAPTTTYLALYKSGSEVTTTIRTAGRVAITWTAPSSGTTATMSSGADADFGAAAGAQDVDEVRVFDAATSGNQLLQHAITNVSVASGENVKFSSGNLTVTG